MSFPIRETFRPGEDDAPLDHARDGFFEDVAASFSAARRLDNFNARAAFEDEIWTERLAEVEAAAGVRMQHPGSVSARVGRYIEGMMFPESAPEDAGRREDAYAQLESRIEALRQSSPELAEAIRPPQFWRDEMGRRARVLDQRANEAGFWSALAGGVGAAFTDPVNLAIAPFGAGASASRTLGVAVARAAGIEAAINVAAEAVNIPIADSWRQELGLEAFTAQEVGVRLGAAATFGGLIGAGGEALGRLSGRTLAEGLDALAPDDPAARAASARLDEDARLVAANPFEAGPETDGLHRARAQDAETVLRAPDSPEARLAAERLAVPPEARPAQSDLFDVLATDDYRLAASAPPPRPDAVDDAPGARRAQLAQLAEASPAQPARIYDADLFEMDESVRTGRAVTGEEIEVRIAADLSAIERFRGCVV
jgi:hypothetical protein